MSTERTMGKAVFIANDVSNDSTKATKSNLDNLSSIFETSCGFTRINADSGGLHKNVCSEKWESLKSVIHKQTFDDTSNLVFAISSHGNILRRDDKPEELCIELYDKKPLSVKDIIDVMQGVGHEDMIKILIVCACRGM